VALSREQFEWLRTAIANWRQAQYIPKQLQRLSREVLFATVPHPTRRKKLKKLGKKVFGLIQGPLGSVRTIDNPAGGHCQLVGLTRPRLNEPA
jgi:hypothetical protein